ncbi:MAG: thiolase family protein [Chloroflexota bacterium]|nr:MAG: thiolase family protein [Chloroflexota bacterium]
MADEVVILGGARTAFGTMGKSLRDVRAGELAAIVIKEALQRTGVAPEQVDEVVLGQVFPNTLEPNLGKYSAIVAGLPDGVVGHTVDRACGSGLQSMIAASLAIQTGDAEIVIAGGAESMSNIPYVLKNARWGYRMGAGKVMDGFEDQSRVASSTEYGEWTMGTLAENIAKVYGISREAQDAFAVESHRRATLAIQAGRFKPEIVPVPVPQKKGPAISFDTDEHPRPETTLEKLAKLSPAFAAGGTVTAGNASGMNDGAAVVVLTTARKARELGIEPVAVLRSYAAAAVEPPMTPVGPVPAARKALKKAGLQLSDIDLFENNEAFAAYHLAVTKDLEWDNAKVNVNGGAIALGHPLGATGGRLILTLINELGRRAQRLGMATICTAGGMGVAVIIERV